jgi:small neutral amino acid transporter SnatA (MarC family)
MISLQTYGWIVSIISIVLVVLSTYLVLHVENPLLKILGSRGSTVTTRIFAIFLACHTVCSRRVEEIIGNWITNRLLNFSKKL